MTAAELVAERRRLLRAVWRAERTPVPMGRRDTKGLQAIMDLELFDLRNPEIAAAFKGGEAKVLP